MRLALVAVVVGLAGAQGFRVRAGSRTRPRSEFRVAAVVSGAALRTPARDERRESSSGRRAPPLRRKRAPALKVLSRESSHSAPSGPQCRFPGKGERRLGRVAAHLANPQAVVARNESVGQGMIRITRYESKAGPHLRVSNSQGGSPGTERGTRARGICCILGSGEEGLRRIRLRSRPARRGSLQRRGSRPRHTGLCPRAMHDFRRDDQRSRASVGVTRSGSLFYAPLLENTSPPPQNTLQGPEWVVRSRDLGATWTKLGSGGPTTGGLVPPWMKHSHPDTSRIWFATTLPNLCGARISWSDDDGDQWQTNPSVGCPAQGGEKRPPEGPPPPLRTKPGRLSARRLLLRKHDRHRSPATCGATGRSMAVGSFSFTGSFSRSHPAAGLHGESPLPTRPSPVPTGCSTFRPKLCGALGVAISHDEGASLAIPPNRRLPAGSRTSTPSGTAADSYGNLYFAWRGPGDLPYLSTSTDHGATWNPPLMVAPPGVRAVRRVAVAVRKRGEVALLVSGNHRRRPLQRLHHRESQRLHGAPPLLDRLGERPCRAAGQRPRTPRRSATASSMAPTRLRRMAPSGPAFHCAKTSACPGQRIGVVGRLTPGNGGS